MGAVLFCKAQVRKHLSSCPSPCFVYGILCLVFIIFIIFVICPIGIHFHHCPSSVIYDVIILIFLIMFMPFSSLITSHCKIKRGGRKHMFLSLSRFYNGGAVPPQLFLLHGTAAQAAVIMLLPVFFSSGSPCIY